MSVTASLRRLFRRLGDGVEAEEAAGLAAPERRHRGRPRAMSSRVRAHLDDLRRWSMHHQPVHGGDGRQAVGDGDHGLAGHQPVEALLDRRLDLRIERAGRLVEDEDRRILEEDAGDRDALALAAGELRAALADMGVEAAAARSGRRGRG